MIIAVTGATGSIGKELVPFLEKLGHTVVKISSSVKNNEEYFYSYDDYTNGRIKFDVDILIHLASYNSSLLEENYNNEIKLSDDIVSGLSSISCKRLIFFSTGKVYGDNSFLFQEFDEFSALNPSCHYSKAKKECEELILQRSHNLEFNSIIFRLAPVLNKSTSSSLGKLMKIAGLGIPLPSLSTGENNQRSFITFSNLLTVMEQVIKDADSAFINEIYNLCDDDYISLNDLFRLNKKSLVIKIPKRVSDQLLKNSYLKNILLRLYGNFVLKNGKLKRDMGVKLNSTKDHYL
ncbi:NAD-dependent epimerase/dehydratase family protein [Gammaproteobacteria bacterium]|jgi:nucleoside-diphosphate-sugar epimerase|nr:NAD-dependent epimerase/dehydratase family protein [Gammaproteobacteria bacterium]|tara:strand:+ start:3866 stop:4741 length:876 start_codon:yes stop_codon:yes gene_type:complete